ncbi:glycosyltransferase [Rhodococcus sp. IEGM 1409]|uniref:glycosyltransferase n=1 Tax=Rhodococcus sp. IEGM 1409 TaxID=3047082 RepID=UPI0024B7578C|nr:glycosyltransferase [Rhodococcus sp. IEGM 1409]MDI9902351.1 glycosyltransferase [Rhodococcus sp. IEGM 1409]
MPIDQVLVVVPAHNEAEDLPNCLRALATAASACVVPVRVVAVLDNCSDGTAGVIPEGVEVLRVEHQNVGRSRATGFSEFGRDLGPSAWFTTTDADSVVGPTWIARQLEYARTADVVAGTVRIADWEGQPQSVRERYERMYHAHPYGRHGHIHGANLGVRADMYWSIGGFSDLEEDEDVDLVRRLSEAGACIAWAEDIAVTTSARLDGRTPGGFAGHIRNLGGTTADNEEAELAR